ncbi:MAG: OmpH family outer membrane protein [Desulfovibrionaceae bacterium]|nr:OmpH family outer membrane protein [Desulfovibrionaceae bacterium]MBF0512706.1 OmpH family outer membrane protein [Desulfovibrionaceae bacterium]
MRKAFVVLAAAMLVFSASAAMAEMKIGVVYGPEVMQVSEAFKKANSELKNKLSPLESESQKAQDEFKKLKDDYDNKSVALTQQAKADKETELKVKYQKVVEIQQRAQQLMQSEQKRLFEPLNALASQVVAEYGAKNGYTLILEGTQTTHYVADSINITKDVIAEIDSAYKAGRMPAAGSTGDAAPAKSKKK